MEAQAEVEYSYTAWLIAPLGHGGGRRGQTQHSCQILPAKSEIELVNHWPATKLSEPPNGQFVGCDFQAIRTSLCYPCAMGSTAPNNRPSKSSYLRIVAPCIRRLRNLQQRL